ncbi:MAG: hypothetical protein AVDCRST_MAG89-2334, partial [uncultured Gemmatimonadetes bacterium]
GVRFPGPARAGRSAADRRSAGRVRTRRRGGLRDGRIPRRPAGAVARLSRAPDGGARHHRGRRGGQGGARQPPRRRHPGHGRPGAAGVRHRLLRVPRAERHRQPGRAGAQRPPVAEHRRAVPRNRHHHQQRRGQPQAVPGDDAAQGRRRLRRRPGAQHRRVRVRPQPAGGSM